MNPTLSEQAQKEVNEVFKCHLGKPFNGPATYFLSADQLMGILKLKMEGGY